MASKDAPSSQRRLHALCVFCGSQSGNDPRHRRAATDIGTALAANGVALVYGGGGTGLMGAVADATLAGGGTVVGIIPEFLKVKELAHGGVTEMVVVPDMHTRKRQMFERADAFCILPGGIGTLDEFFEIASWRQLHRHNKPIIVVNVAGYWSHLVALLENITGCGFAHDGHGALITVVDDAAAVIPTVEQELATPKPPIVLDIDGIRAFSPP